MNESDITDVITEFDNFFKVRPFFKFWLSIFVVLIAHITAPGGTALEKI